MLLLKKAYYHIPQSFLDLSEDKKKEQCNGCGVRICNILFICNSFFGLDMSEICKIHDHMYSVGTTDEDKEFADIAFLKNMYAHILLYTSGGILLFLRELQCTTFYLFVFFFGQFFFNRKNRK